jgi:hypothetical protein
MPERVVGEVLAVAAHSVLGPPMPDYEPGHLAWRQPASD